MRTRSSGAFALCLYLLLSFAYFGLPIVAHPGRDVVGSVTDPKIFIWSFGWWPHALLHGLNPIVSHSIWAPTGYNLTWATSMPGLSLVFAPLTLLAGPVVAFNVASILMPALAGWTAFLLCRHVSRAFVPSLLGGYVFAFSSYMLGHEEGHLNLTAVFLIPLLALSILRYLEHATSRRRFAAELGLLLAAQISVSTEVFATVTLALGAGWVLAYGLDSALRIRLRAMVAPVAGGYGIACVLTSPLLYYAFSDFRPGKLGPTELFTSDAANLIVPTRTAALGGSWFSTSFSGNELEQTAYLGLPLVLVLALFAFRRWGTPSTRFLIAAIALAVLASFGRALYVNGHREITLPWRLISGLPVIDNVYPGRLMLYAFLAAAVAVAMWASSRADQTWLRIGLGALVVASFLPTVGNHRWHQTFQVPAFFTNGDVSRCLAPNENILALPYDYRGNSTLWQSVNGFHFRMAGGEIGNDAPKAFDDTLAHRLLNAFFQPGEGSKVFAFASDHKVSTIIVDPTDPFPWTTYLNEVAQPRNVGGVLLYRVGAARPLDQRCR